MTSLIKLSVFFAATFLSCAAWADVTFQVTADTTAIAGQQGYLDLEFNGVPPNQLNVPNAPIQISPNATAVVSNFQSDATWNTDYANYPSWDNPPALDNVTGTPLTGMTMVQDEYTNPNDQLGSDFDLLGTFGTYIKFDVTISGDVFNPVGPTDSNNYLQNSPDSFYVDFFNSDTGMLLENSSLQNPLNGITIAAGGDITTQDQSDGGETGVIITQVVPEPASLGMIALGGIALTGRRRNASIH